MSSYDDKMWQRARYLHKSGYRHKSGTWTHPESGHSFKAVGSSGTITAKHMASAKRNLEKARAAKQYGGHSYSSHFGSGLPKGRTY